MANSGRYVDRNPEMRAAGVASSLESYGTKDLLLVVHMEEEAENRIRALCRQSRPNPSKRTPKIPTNQIGDILSNSDKGLFAEFQNRFRESMFSKKPALGEVKATHSKPDSVTNLSRTFGRTCVPEPEDSLYCVVLPPKSAEQVNREFAQFHVWESSANSAHAFETGRRDQLEPYFRTG